MKRVDYSDTELLGSYDLQFLFGVDTPSDRERVDKDRETSRFKNETERVDEFQIGSRV